MTPQVSYYPRYAKLGLRAVVLALVLSGALIVSPARFGAGQAAAKPMPAIESAWVAKQAQIALDDLSAVDKISAIEQRDVASWWIKNIALIVAKHLEIDNKELEQNWLSASPARQKVLFAALTQLGVPYKTNADEPGVALDCSALIKFAWSSAGVNMPRASAQQYAFGERVDSSEVQLGDLAWYPGHISISLGVEGVVIQAPRNGRKVEIHKIGESRIDWVRWISPTT